MKKFNLFVLFLVVCPMFAFGQLKVTPNGETTASNNIYIGNSSSFLGTTSTSIPVVFKTGSTLAGNTGSSGSYNVTFGYDAMPTLAGSYNTAIGRAALKNSTGGSYNTASGYNALYNNNGGNCNSAYGSYALYNNSGGYNSAYGSYALYNNAGISNSAFGHYALYANTSASNNSAFGYCALRYNQTGNRNNAYGYYALYNNTNSDNSAFGYYALYANTSASGNSAFGNYALRNNQTGSRNNAFGYYALYNNTNSDNSAFGYYALYSNTTGNCNSAFGSYSLYSNTTGSCNSAFGYYALYNNKTSSSSSLTGSYNTANGYYALTSNNEGYYNTANGYVALRNNTKGNYNVANGTYALYLNTEGSFNTANGHYTLYSNTTGSYNTAVGEYAGAINANNLTNATSIGYSAHNFQSNEVVLGNTSITRFIVGINVTNISDRRAKKNIRTEVPGLAFVNLLQPITYTLDLDALDEITKSDDPEINKFTDSLRLARTPEEEKILADARANKEKQVYSGFIAQDVEKAAQSIGYDFSGVDAPENDRSPYGLRYAEFVVPLVKAVQELNEQLIEQNNRLSEQNNRLQEQINELTDKLNELTNAPKNQYAGNVGVINESDATNNFSFSLFPNPTTGFVTVDYTLHIDAPICIELYNMFGQKMKMIVPQQNQKAGTYSIQISVGNLGTGTYIVKASSGNQVENKQLVINN